ncbi:MAG: hypothetical protein JWP18_2369 [Solirubrobacterales bacterium]|jgi:hypothetical protein|nr:hypothetical protein [Solirubrobacterales bacterium]
MMMTSRVPIPMYMVSPPGGGFCLAVCPIEAPFKPDADEPTIAEG